MIPIAILFSQVKVQSADQSETFLISGIPKEYDDLTESVQLEWFLQDIDSDDTVQVHADAYLYGEGEVVNAKEGLLLLAVHCLSIELAPEETPGLHSASITQSLVGNETTN